MDRAGGLPDLYRVTRSRRNVAWTGGGALVAVAVLAMLPYIFYAGTTDLLVQQPPGADNWCIGCQGTVLSEAMPGGDGTILPNGIYDSLGTPVTPGSLYLAQLNQRLGITALNNIGYADVNGTPLQ